MGESGKNGSDGMKEDKNNDGTGVLLPSHATGGLGARTDLENDRPTLGGMLCNDVWAKFEIPFAPFTQSGTAPTVKKRCGAGNDSFRKDRNRID